jgi:hypothetical protein
MYKKITHTIVEEHFDGADSEMIRMSTKLRQPAMTEQALRDFVTDYFNRYNDKMNMLISTVTTPADITNVSTELFQIADEFGNHAKQYYGLEFGEAFNSINKSALVNHINAVMLAQQKKDTLFNRNRVNTLANDFAGLFTIYNNRWLYNDILPVFTNWLMGYMDQIDALTQKNTAAADTAKTSTSAAINTLINTYVSGTVDKYRNMFL